MKSLIAFLMLFALPAFADGIKISWQDNSDNEKVFLIERKEHPGGAFGEIAQAPENSTEFEDTTIEVDKLYCYRVRGSNNAGEGGYATLKKPDGTTETEACMMAVASDLSIRYTRTIIRFESAPGGTQ